MGDTATLIWIVSVLIVSNLVAGVITTEFGGSSSTFDQDTVLSDVEFLKDDVSEANSFTLLKIISGVLIWSFGLFPFWLDIMFLILRITGWLIVLKIARGVGS